jgi:hypothetical protein
MLSGRKILLRVVKRKRFRWEGETSLAYMCNGIDANENFLFLPEILHQKLL